MQAQIINDRYQIESRLGRGNQGDVLLAMDLKLDRHVAIKMLRVAGGFDEDAEQSLKREAMVTARFRHPNVVSLYDYDISADNGWPFLVMEYLQGQTLDKLIVTLSEAELRLLVSQVGSALQKAHDIGLVHRDLKPSNLMLVDRGKPEQRFVILDLGIAKLTDVAKKNFSTFGSMTFSGAGTPFYMAPEQATARSIDHRADIYAMGSIIYEFLSGDPPFSTSANSLSELLNAVVGKTPDPLGQVCPGKYSAELDALINQCLEKEPERRPDSMNDLVGRFLEAYGPGPSNTVTPPPPPMPGVVPPPVAGTTNNNMAAQTDTPGLGQTAAWHSPVANAPSAPPVAAPSNETHQNLTATTRGSVDDTHRRKKTQPEWTTEVGTKSRPYGLLIAIASAICVLLAAGITFVIWIAVNGWNGSSNQGGSDENQIVFDEETLDFGSDQINELERWSMTAVFANDAPNGFELGEGAPEGMSINSKSGRLSWTPTERQGPGEYDVTIIAKREDNKATQAKLHLTVNEVNRPPTITPIGRLSSSEFQEVRFTVDAVDPDYPSSQLQYRFDDSAPDGASLDPTTGEFAWTPDEDDGPGNFETRIAVSDGQATAYVIIRIDVSELSIAPQVGSVEPIEVNEGETVSFTINVDDPDSTRGDLTYSLAAGAPDGATVDSRTRRFSWTPREEHGPGEHRATILVSDGANSTPLEVLITVKEVAQPPQLPLLEDQEVQVGRVFRYQIPAVDPDIPGMPLSYSISDGPPNMTVDEETGEIQWEPGIEDNGQTVTVNVAVAKQGFPAISTPLEIVVRRADVIITNSIGMEFRLIPNGEFNMGSPERESRRISDEIQRPVVISRPFYLGRFEVTQFQYERVMGVNPSAFRVGGEHSSQVRDFNTDEFPVDSVSWEDAMEFCRRLNERERGTGRRYRLPTEAEWEYACRAGTTTPFSFGRRLNGREANCDGNFPYGTLGKSTYLERTSEVGSYASNAFGLFDMHGNVFEWCLDWYDDYESADEPLVDPTGPEDGSKRVLRGGSWDSRPQDCRAANRQAFSPDGRVNDAGFRVICEFE